MKCFKCDRSALQGYGLFRQNPKGEEGIWACEEHDQTKPDPEVKEIVNIIARAVPPNDS